MPAQKGSKVLGSRKNVERRIAADIDARDRADIDKGQRGLGVFRTANYVVPMYPGEFGKISKSEEAGYKDAVRRQNRRGYAVEGFDADTGKGISKKEGDETSKRLIKNYKNRNYAKGGSVSSASKRADGCATKGKTKGRFV
jgi:hypothetical protein